MNKKTNYLLIKILAILFFICVCECFMNISYADYVDYAECTDKEKIAFDLGTIMDYVDKVYVIEEKEDENGLIYNVKDPIKEDEQVLLAWTGMFDTDGTTLIAEGETATSQKEAVYFAVSQALQLEVDPHADSTQTPIYQNPQKSSKVNSEEQNIDKLIQNGDTFLEGGTTDQLDNTALQNFSKSMFNILFAVGVVVSVITGALLGLKLMVSSIEEQVEAKKLIIPYVIGCIVLFGGFGIWRILVTILQGI